MALASLARLMILLPHSKVNYEPLSACENILIAHIHEKLYRRIRTRFELPFKCAMHDLLDSIKMISLKRFKTKQILKIIR